MPIPQNLKPQGSGGGRRPPTSPMAWPLRPVLLLGSILAAGLFLAMALLPIVATVGNAAQRITDELGCPEGVKPIYLHLPSVAQRSTILANDGSVMATLFLENRKVVKLDKVAPVAKQAVLAIEDYQFYEHGGVDVKAIFRAGLADIRSGHITQGGSTISQQLVKVISNERADTLSRKVCEAEQANDLEERYGKNTILEMYLNEIYLGHGAYGMEAAAETYFGKHAGALTLPQAAMLAGMIANPSQYDPVSNPEAVTRRRNTVLGRMAAIGWVPRDEAEAAQAEPLGLVRSVSKPQDHKQPLFVQFVRKLITEDAQGEFGNLGNTRVARQRAMFQGGLTIHTTINPAWQEFAVQTVRRHLPKKTDPQAAIATVEPGTGAVRVLVSGRDFAKTQTDLVWQAQHQEGSAFKPYTLVAAFREGVPPGQVYSSESPAEDLKERCNGWEPFNAEGAGDFGYLDLYEATADSINVVFGRLTADIGPEAVAKAATDMGIHLSRPVHSADCSVTLGTFETSPLDMATAYATLAAGGIYCPYYGVQKIQGPGPDHKVLYRHDPDKTCNKKAVEPDIAYQVTDMLKGVIDHGTGAARAPLADGRPEAGKTGTTEDYENAWFCGYVPQLATAVWLGYPGTPRPMLGITDPATEPPEYFDHMFGGDIPARMWSVVMSRFTAHMQPEDFPAPPPPPTGDVPDVIGRDQEVAIQILHDASFTGIVDGSANSLAPIGTVISQSPGGGTTTDLGALVHLTISNGQPPKVHVPRVVGMKQDDAVTTLHDAQLQVDVQKVDVSDPAQEGIVVDQNPNGGTKVLADSTVTISVGHYVKPSPTPPPPTTPPPTTEPPPSPSPSPEPSPTDSPKPKKSHPGHSG